ncbi:MAG: hypothetical protein Q9217_000845 [Psora testacea]
MAALPKRIIKETERLMAEPVPGISAVPHEDNLRYFDVKIHGPSQSPYEGGIFKLELFLPDDYPMTPPKIRFLTKIYHPNIDKLGRICLDVLKSNWSPALQIRTILLSIQALLGAPNPDDPLANDVAQEWKVNEPAAIQTAKEWTRHVLSQAGSNHPHSSKEFVGISPELTPPRPLCDGFPTTPGSMFPPRSRKPHSKVSLSVNTIAANRNNDEQVFDAEPGAHMPEKSGVEASKNSKTKRGRKVDRKDFRVFQDDDDEVKALERSYLRAHFGVSSTRELYDTPKPMPNGEDHTSQASIYSHTNSEISDASGVSTETVKALGCQHSPASAGMVARAKTSITDEFKDMLDARARKSHLNVEDQQQLSLELPSSPYVMNNNKEMVASADFDSTSNPDSASQVEGTTFPKQSSFDSCKCTSPWATPLPASPAVLTQPTSPSSIYSNDVMRIPRKTIGCASSKSTSASITPLENSPIDSLVTSFDSNWSSSAPSGFPSESETLSDEEIRRRSMRRAAYDAYKVPSKHTCNSTYQY